MITYFKNNITAQNVVDNFITIGLLYSVTAPSLFKITYFSYSQVSENDITFDASVIMDGNAMNVHYVVKYNNSKMYILLKSNDENIELVDVEVNEVYLGTA
jgi:hypothetical protein